MACSLVSAPVFASSLLAALAGATAWLSAGTLAVVSGDAERVAALPSVSFLILAVVVAVVAAILARLHLSEAWPLAISFLIWLPFMPGNIPNAFLLWQGPIEGMVWLTVMVGLIYARTWSPPLGAQEFGHHKWIAALAAATLALFAFNQVRAVVPNGDEPHYLAATQSLIGDRDLKVENNYARGDYLQYFRGRLQPHFLQRSAAGEIYSIHSPGVSVIVLPAFLIAGYAGAALTVIVIAALTAALTWMVAWRLTASVAAAWVGLTAVFATAPFLFHTFTIYPDGIGALMVMIGVWLIVRLLDDDVPSQPQLAATGAALALLPWLHTRFVLLSATLGLIVIALLATKRIRPTRIAAFLAVPAVAAAAWFAYFWIIWGTPSPLAPYGRDTESSASYIGRGLAGLVFDQQFGVLATAPVYAMVIIGLWALIRRAKLALALVLVTVPYAIAVSTYAMWWGGTSAPARFLGALLPLAALVIACAWATYPKLRIATLLLLLGSIALVVPRLTEEGGRLVFTGRNVFDATIEWLSRNVDLALALPSVHRDGPGVAIIDALPWLLAIFVMCGESIGVAIMRRGRGAAWTIVTLSSAAMVMFAATAVWAMRDANPVTPDRAMLASVAAYEPLSDVCFDARQFKAISCESYLSRFAIEAPVSDGTSLLRLRRIPAGEYEVVALAPDRRLTITVDRSDPPIEYAADSPFRLTLPIDLLTLNVRGGTEVAAGAPALRFRPVDRPPGSRRHAATAIHAARYGSARVFFVDEGAYPEARGFWTRAETRTMVVIDADAMSRRDGRTISITAGAAATTMGVSAGSVSESFSLTPGQRHTVKLPPLHDAQEWIVFIDSGPGFRPFEREPGSTDVRYLAAWLEIP